MPIYKFDKLVIRAAPNAEKFLNGLTSNTLDQPQNAFLNQHGRIIAAFDQVRSGPDEFLLVISPPAWQPLKDHTDKFARLNKTNLDPLPLNVYFDLGGDFPREEGDLIIAQKAGRLIITGRQVPDNVSAGEFTLFRVNYLVPVQGIDYNDELVLNVDETAFVSYTKGCFLGQEPVAKVHNRSKPTWKLAVRYKDELGAQLQGKMTSVCREPETGREKGFIFVANN